MMDHKKTISKEARAKLMVMVSDIFSKREKELIEKYKPEDGKEVSKSENAKIILLGNWMNNAVKMMMHGATKEELEAVMEHMAVIICSIKDPVDIRKSYKEKNLLGLCKKYCGSGIPEKRDYADRQKQLEHATKKRNVLKLKREGKTNEEIAKELDIPESTVRFFLRNVEK